MIDTCSQCRRNRVIGFSNRHGLRLCLPCLEAYLLRRRIEAGLETAPEWKPAPAEQELHQVAMPMRVAKVVVLGDGYRVVLTGEIPTRVSLGGRWYEVCLNPTNGNGHGRKQA